MGVGGKRKKKGGEVNILENLLSIHVITVYKIQTNSNTNTIYITASILFSFWFVSLQFFLFFKIQRCGG